MSFRRPFRIAAGVVLVLAAGAPIGAAAAPSPTPARALRGDNPLRTADDATRDRALADAWVTYRAHCGVTRDSVTTHYGIDAIHLVRHRGEWRISGLTFTHEVPGAPLGRP